MPSRHWRRSAVLLKDSKLFAYVPEGSWPDRYADGQEMCFIFDSILTRYAEDCKYREYGEVPLSSAILRQVCGRNYKRAIDTLLHYGLIETNGSFIKGRSCRKYSIGPIYKSQQLMKVEIEKKRLKNRILEFYYNRENEHKQTIETAPDIYQYLCECVKELDIDGRGYLLPENILYYIDAEKKNKPEYDYMEAYNTTTMLVEKIRNGQHFFKKDTNNRLHTNLTNIKSGLRKHFTYRGENLTWYDIHCCQPVFLAIHLDNQYLYSSSYINSVLPSNHPSHPTVYPLLCTFELDKFRYDVENNLFYDKLAKFTNKPRKKTKIDILTFMFAPNNEYSVYGRYFDEHYPSIQPIHTLGQTFGS
jgi:hypothetical protein